MVDTGWNRVGRDVRISPRSFSLPYQEEEEDRKQKILKKKEFASAKLDEVYEIIGQGGDSSETNIVLNELFTFLDPGKDDGWRAAREESKKEHSIVSSVAYDEEEHEAVDEQVEEEVEEEEEEEEYEQIDESTVHRPSEPSYSRIMELKDERSSGDFLNTLENYPSNDYSYLHIIEETDEPETDVWFDYRKEESVEAKVLRKVYDFYEESNGNITAVKKIIDDALVEAIATDPELPPGTNLKELGFDKFRAELPVKKLYHFPEEKNVSKSGRKFVLVREPKVKLPTLEEFLELINIRGTKSGSLESRPSTTSIVSEESSDKFKSSECQDTGRSVDLKASRGSLDSIQEKITELTMNAKRGQLTPEDRAQLSLLKKTFKEAMKNAKPSKRKGAITYGAASPTGSTTLSELYDEFDTEIPIRPVMKWDKPQRKPLPKPPSKENKIDRLAKRKKCAIKVINELHYEPKKIEDECEEHKGWEDLKPVESESEKSFSAHSVTVLPPSRITSPSPDNDIPEEILPWRRQMMRTYKREYLIEKMILKKYFADGLKEEYVEAEPAKPQEQVELVNHVPSTRIEDTSSEVIASPPKLVKSMVDPCSSSSSEKKSITRTEGDSKSSRSLKGTLSAGTSSDIIEPKHYPSFLNAKFIDVKESKGQFPVEAVNKIRRYMKRRYEKKGLDELWNLKKYLGKEEPSVTTLFRGASPDQSDDSEFENMMPAEIFTMRRKMLKQLAKERYVRKFPIPVVEEDECSSEEEEMISSEDSSNKGDALKLPTERKPSPRFSSSLPTLALGRTKEFMKVVNPYALEIGSSIDKMEVQESAEVVEEVKKEDVESFLPPKLIALRRDMMEHLRKECLKERKAIRKYFAEPIVDDSSSVSRTSAQSPPKTTFKEESDDSFEPDPVLAKTRDSIEFPILAKTMRASPSDFKSSSHCLPPLTPEPSISRDPVLQVLLKTETVQESAAPIKRIWQPPSIDELGIDSGRSSVTEETVSGGPEKESAMINARKKRLLEYAELWSEINAVRKEVAKRQTELWTTPVWNVVTDSDASLFNKEM